MSLFRGIDDGDAPREPAGRLGGTEEIRPAKRSEIVAAGTLACPSCDAPVAPIGRMSPAHALTCPYCFHWGRVRDFLTLGAPTRPAHVEVRIARRLTVRPRP